MIARTRKTSRIEAIVFAIELYFDGLSLDRVPKTLNRFVRKSNIVAIRDWIKKYRPQRPLPNKKSW